MRPTKLRISAFGPYAKEVKLEMNDLGEKGLYLITGSTGAGKTSIFDAIVYALYGEPSGDNRDESMLRSKYAAIDTPTEVELEFVKGGKLYTVKRNPEYKRPAKKGGGTTTQLARAELKYPDGRVVDKSKKEVTRAVEELIGINRNQFLRIAMIAQGDFLKLLLAKTEERMEIFRRIFKTQKFEEIQNRLKEDVKQLKDRFNSVNQKLKTYASGIICDPEHPTHPLIEQAKEGALSTNEGLALLEALIDEDCLAETELKREISKTAEKLDAVKGKILRAEEYAKNKKEYEYGLSRLKVTEEELSAAKDAKEQAEKAAKKAEILGKDINGIENELPKYTESKAIAMGIASLEKALRTDQLKKKEAEENQDKKFTELEKAKKRLLELEGTEARLVTAENNNKKLEEKKADLDRLSLSLKDYRSDLATLETSKKGFEILLGKANALRDKYNSLSDAFLNAQAGIMASTLRKGTPCPVCGATEHLRLAVLPDNAPTEARVKSAKQDYDSADAEAKKASKECGTLTGKLEEKRKTIEGDIAKLLGDTPTENAEDRIAEELQKAENELATAKAELEKQQRLLAEKKGLSETTPTLDKELKDSEAKGRELSEAIKLNSAALTEKQDSLAKLNETLRFGSESEAMDKKAELEREKQILEDTLKAAVESFNRAKSQLDTLKGRLEALEKIVNEKCDLDLEAEKERLNTLNSTYAELEKKRGSLSDRLNNNLRCRDNIMASAKEAAKIEALFKWKNTLSETANGDLSGKDKIKLETYVQMNYFDRIIARANIRLNKMSGGQYDLVRRVDREEGADKDHKSDKRSQKGLDLDIIDHNNGTTRPVNTLSGGESFKASLALALGLSDEIQASAGGVQLDTMFVDEGFGSLDPDSLQLAMSTLQELTEGNRLVGIISHVEEFKTKIGKQIVVTKAVTGGSKCEIKI